MRSPAPGVLRFDDVEIDLERRMVTRDGELVQLSRTEWLLLQHLAANAGKVVLHTELLTKVWGPEYRDDLQYLRVWVSRVRRKLGAEPGEPGRIKTFQGIGYLLDVEPAQPAEPRTPTSSPSAPRTRAHRRTARATQDEASPHDEPTEGSITNQGSRTAQIGASTRASAPLLPMLTSASSRMPSAAGRPDILQRWLDAARSQPFHRERPSQAVADHIPRLFDAVVALLRRDAGP